MSIAANRAKSTPLLFVYGTLMKGFREDWQRKVEADFVGRGTMRASLYDLGDYPGARLGGAKPGERVSGELYRLRGSTHALKILDKYEEFFPLTPKKSLFIRRQVPVTLEDGRKKRAWAYFYNRPVSYEKLIPGGSYRERVASIQSSLGVGSHSR